MALTLNGSTGISGIAGSAGTPALQGNNDTNTGYFFAADTLGLSTAGNERLRITAAGNLALGNDGSFPIFDNTNDRTIFIGTGSDDAGIQLHSATDRFGGIYFGDATSGTDRYSGYIEYKHNDNYLRFATGSTEKVRITSDGDVGIGVSPSSGIKLHIKDTTSDGAIKLEGTGSTLGTWITLQNNDATANSYSMIQGADAGGQGTSEIKFINVNNSNNEGTLTVGTRPSGGSMQERLRIDSAGRIKIGTTSAAATNEAVTIKGDSNGDCFISLRSSAHADGNDQRIRFMVGDAIGSSGNVCSSISSEIIQTSSGVLKANLVISANRGDASTNRYIIYGDNSVDHEFKTKTAASLLKLHNSGLVEIADGDLKVASGHGIDFSATADGTGSPDELLDDYEEGQFNPGIAGSTSAGSSVYSSIEGHYTKIGNRVHLDIYIDQTSATGTGQIRITGAPFACAGGSPGPQVAGSCMLSNVVFDTGFQNLTPHIWSGSSEITIYGTKNNTTWNVLTMTSNTGTGPSYIISITYPTA